MDQGMSGMCLFSVEKGQMFAGSSKNMSPVVVFAKFQVLTYQKKSLPQLRQSHRHTDTCFNSNKTHCVIGFGISPLCRAKTLKSFASEDPQ